MSLQIHWHEGLFLQPHHLQRFQKNVFDLTAQERSLHWSYPYGVINFDLSNDDLENIRIRFDRLRAVMPSGLEIDFPRNADLPSIEIKQALASRPGGVRVYLGVPLWLDGRENALESQAGDSRAKLIYRSTEVQYADENTGKNEKPIRVRHINARLLLEGEDQSDLEILPLLRVIRSAGEAVGIPRQDPDFVPPCLVTHASPVLRELLRDLASQVQASRAELQVQVTRGGGFSLETLRGLQFEQLMRLRSLNRFAGRLPSLAEAPGIAPFTMYLELRELLGELTALYPERNEFDVAPYQHDNPILAFRELSTKIRGLLRGAVAPSFIKVPFVKGGDGLLAATLTEEHFTAPSDYFLGIKTKEDPRGLTAFVEDADGFKFMPKSMATRAVRGVLLKEERFQPLELPAQSELHYYRLLRTESQRVWQQMQTEKAAIIRWMGREDADYDVALYMTIPPDKASR